MVKMCCEHKYVLIFCAQGIWFSIPGCAMLYAELKRQPVFQKGILPDADFLMCSLLVGK